MEEQFVTYEIALKLRELGFKEKCYAYFLKKDTLKVEIKIDMSFMLQAPLWQQVIDWFEEKQNIIITETPLYMNKSIGECELVGWINRLEGLNKQYKTRKEAREQAILKAIELIK